MFRYNMSPKQISSWELTLTWHTIIYELEPGLEQDGSTDYKSHLVMFIEVCLVHPFSFRGT